MKLNTLKVASIAFISLIAVACGELSGEYTGADKTDQGRQAIGGLRAVGMTSSRFLLNGTADNGGDSGHSFRLRFKLVEGKPLSFHFFADRKLKNGLKVTARRADGMVYLDLFLGDGAISQVMDAFEGEEIVDIDLDAHNNETTLHVLVWKHGGPYGDSYRCRGDGECLLNTEDYSQNSNWVGQAGGGAFWGLEGDFSLVRKLEGPLKAKSDA